MTDDVREPNATPVPDIEVWIIDSSGALEDDDDFSPPVPSPAGEVERQASWGWRKPSGVKKVDPQEFLDSWQATFKTIQSIFQADDARPKPENPFVLESITAKLSISAKGKVVFVGELGGEVSFEACYQRRP